MPAEPVPGGTSWRKLVSASAARTGTVPLALGVELRQADTGGGPWEPQRSIAASPASVRRGAARHLSVGLRPLLRSSATGTWIKGDVSWEVLRRPGGRHDPQHARWFAELHSIARELRTLGPYVGVAEWLTLDGIESTLLWPHLARAEELGIPLVAVGKNSTITRATSASVSVAVGERADRGLALSPRVEIDGTPVDAAHVRPIGHSGIYAFRARGAGIDLTLAAVPVGETLRALLSGGAPVAVPPGDVREFFDEFYPRIAQDTVVEPVGDLRLPAISPLSLLVRVRFHGRDDVSWALSWRYAGRDDAPFAPDAAAHRDAASEQRISAAVEAVWDTVSDEPFAASGDLHGIATAEFATRTLPALAGLDEVRVEVTGSPRPYRELTSDPEITVTTVEGPDPDWFELGVIVTIDGHRIPFTPLFTALALRRKKMLLGDGHYFSLTHPALDRLRELIDEAGDLEEWETGPRISRYQTALWADFEDLADLAVPAVSWRATAEGLRGVDTVPETPLPVALRATLRPYQRTGFDWLAFLWSHRLGGILADDMGLGKTLQILALIAHARETGERRPFLVVAPTSVLSTWRTEAARFTPDLSVAVIDATRRKRGSTVADAAASADIVVTSYTLLRLDETEFATVPWAGLVLDEAQFVKNAATKQHRAARAVRADVTIAVTGTPLENSLSELWALLSLTAPGLFASSRRFREEYVWPIEKGRVPENTETAPYRATRLARLRHRIRPLVLRRTKEHVAADLPPKQEQSIELELAPAHRALYDTVMQRERKKILGLIDDLDRNRFIVFRSLTLLRLLSLAPELVDPAHAHIPSSKLDALLDHLAEIVAEGHRILVFSQFTSFLALAAQRLDAAGIAYAYLDGSTRTREKVIDDFRGGDAPVFLISLKAGGFGLTLTEADYVFLLDPWWNPAAEAQAIDRTHRIGQERSVMVYRLIATGTIEEKVMALQQRKARLFASVLDDDEMFSQAITADDIRALLAP